MPDAHAEHIPATDEGDAVRLAVAANMRRSRLMRSLSLRDLATQTGLSKALLSRIERADANPTMATLTAIAAALDLTFSELTRTVQREPLVMRGTGRTPTTSGARMLFTQMERRRFDVSEGVLLPGDRGVRSDHGHGALEYGYVVSGRVELTVGEQTLLLEAGDAVQFSAESPHTYRALDVASTVVTVVAYSDA